MSKLAGVSEMLKRMMAPASQAMKPLISVDCETTGLNPESDRIISIGAVKIENGVMKYGASLSLLINDEAFTGDSSVGIHGILPAETKSGLPPEAAIAKFMRWVGNTPLLGYNIGFDHAILSRYVRQVTGAPLKNPKLELLDIARRHIPALAEEKIDGTFECIASYLGVPLSGRHSALGDAVSVGLVLLAIQKKYP